MPGPCFWCQEPSGYTMTVGYVNSKGRLVTEHYGQPAIKPCQASGAPAATPKTVPGFAGTVVGGLTAWSESSKVIAAPTR
jgi:hypothetical protein